MGCRGSSAQGTVSPLPPTQNMLTQVRLLRVLQTVSSLAAATAAPPPASAAAEGDEAPAQQPQQTGGAAEALRGLALGALWDELSACMGAVAALEGLGDAPAAAAPAGAPADGAVAMAVDGAAGAGGEAAAAAAAAGAPAGAAERRPSLTGSSSLAGLLARCVVAFRL